MSFYCYINGQLLLAEQASLKINDLGLLRGFGLFDYMRTYNGKPFMPQWYMERLFNSAQAMDLEIPTNETEILYYVEELFNLAKQPDCAFRFLLTGGYSMDSMTVRQPNFVIMTEPLPVQPQERFDRGVKIISTEHLRELPEVKSTNYIKPILMAKQIKASNAYDVLYYKNNEISELSRSNFFIFKGDTLITPDKNILKGITRRLILELAKPYFKIEERTVSLAELKQADEAFTTGTTKKVMPIVQIDDLLIGNGEVGKRTRHLQNLFNHLIDNY
ncbi:aminotransferase class IV [Thermoflexibacter ruber]|uniref:branched-chain-amino-acid transaminase n=1 Tax=Thermoflexibacter ruber TaxID=1003 RepID=A0A1I2ETF6_9BACT|nr:aminotransferase class IV [Thermoflexibacter ruber]SFE95748.1 branched-chain amino acid aminotransferase [Thermoflexibacter ruber]